jgi:NADPH-dependent 2,4-dienoyl-CoA reductase/sulfur reductase-like enzyme
VIALRRIVVVGASQAGYTAAVALRNLGFDGAITLLGDEPHQPYARPPLSKGVLLGSEPDDSVFLPPTDGIELLTSVKAVRLDRDKSRVQVDDGDTIAYDGLVIATGARARRLSGRSTEITVRTLDDAVLLRRSLADVSDIAIVGAGFLGLEIASSAADLGKKATVIDQVTPLVGRLGPLLSDMCLTAAADKGVKVRVSRDGVEISDHAPGRLQAANGAVLAEADLVVTAVGDIPNTEWLDDSGLMLATGWL